MSAVEELPTVQQLVDAMNELGCLTRNGACRTHGGSVLVHDGGRVACRKAWEKFQSNLAEARAVRREAETVLHLAADKATEARAAAREHRSP